MPFKSQAQRRKFYAMANRGEISKQTVSHWESATGDKKLPERVGHKKESQFFGHGVAQALVNLGLVPTTKTAASPRVQQELARLALEGEWMANPVTQYAKRRLNAILRGHAGAMRIAQGNTEGALQKMIAGERAARAAQRTLAKLPVAERASPWAQLGGREGAFMEG